MEDKPFELLSKLYGEVTSLRDEVKTVSKSQMRFENELTPKIEAALDGYKQVYEKLTKHGEKLESIDNKLEKQEVDITVIKGGKKLT